jgi:tight adherence protein C
VDTDLFYACITVLLALTAAWVWFLVRERAARRRKLSLRAQGKYGQEARPKAQAGKAGVDLTKGLLEALARVGELFAPKKAEEVSEGRVELIRAGYRKGSAFTVFWGFKMGLALGGLGVAALLNVTVLEHAQGHYVALAYLMLPGIGLQLPSWWLRGAGNARKKSIRNALPDALDLLVVCVEAGMGLDQAVFRVSQELRGGYPVMSEEFRQLNLELRAGKSRRDGLKNLAWRIGIDDVNSLTALLIQSDLFGTSIAQTLRVYADAMRTKRFQLAEEKAAKLPVKMLLPLIFFILPPLFIVIVGPGVIRLIKAMGGSLF